MKSLVDDCVRVIRVVQREFPRLDPAEQADLADYIRKTAPRMEELFPLPAPASKS